MTDEKNRLRSFLICVAVLLAALVFVGAAEGDAWLPDYSRTEDWAWFALGEEKAADLFLICPTVDTRDETNMSMDDAKTKANFLGALNMERGIYEESARLYAPYYR